MITRDTLAEIPWERVRPCPKCDKLYWASRVEAGACPKCADAFSKQKSLAKWRDSPEGREQALLGELLRRAKVLRVTDAGVTDADIRQQFADPARRQQLLKDYDLRDWR